MSGERFRRSFRLARLVALVLFGGGVVGCVHTYDLSHPTIAPLTTKLDRGGSAYVALPKDGTLDERVVYEGSGRYTAEVLRKVFREYLPSVQMATKDESYGGALESAKSSRAMYLIFPEILHWEDRQTAWSGKPDRILLRVSVIEAQTGKPLDSVEIAGKSKWATLGGDDPKDLVEVPVRQYAASLF